MSLPFPNLDDKTFDELVEEAQSLIPRYAPEWTDHNLSDPGMAFIELFAWLTEMQIYSLNKVRDRHYLKFLKLIGTQSHSAKQAKVDVTFDLEGRNQEFIPIDKGTKVSTIDNTSTDHDIVFETDEELVITSLKLVKVVSKEDSQWIDKTEYNSKENIYYFAFGESASENNMLYFGFSAMKAFPTKDIKLSFNVYNLDLPEPGNSSLYGEQTIFPSVELSWHYSDGFEWKPLSIIADNTAALTRSGRITFEGPNDIALANLKDIESGAEIAHQDLLYWIRVKIQKSGYEFSPRLDTVLVNTISCFHADTKLNWYCQTFESTGLPSQTIGLSNPPVAKKSLKLQVRESDNHWQTWQQVESFEKSDPFDTHYMLSSDKTKIIFGDGFHGRFPMRDKADPINIKVFRFSLGKNSDMFSGTGLPFQVIKLDRTPIVKDSQKVEIYEANDLWHSWQEMTDFDASGPNDRHYIIDLNNGIISFGDGIHGSIPPLAENNICVVQYTVGGGVIGNIPPGAIKKIVDLPIYGITVENKRSATGGKDAELLLEAKKRIRKELKNRHRAITSKDYEDLALATPGIRVARAKVLALYHPDYPQIKMPGAVTVVVLPFDLPDTNKDYPGPSNGFRKTVMNFLNDRRLATTKIFVIGPKFIKATVDATIAVDLKMSSETVRTDVALALKAFLDPLTGGPEKTGWPFGRYVLKSEIYQVIENVPGVKCVLALALSAKGCFKTENGNIKIPKIGLVCSGSHEIKTT